MNKTTTGAGERHHWMRGLIALMIGAVGGVLMARADETGPGYDIEMGRLIPMRDGIELEAWITKPSHLKAPAPTILTLTQYDIDGGRRKNSAAFSDRGYVFVQALVRGRGRSGGVKADNLGLQVGRDGADLVEWIAAQPWSDGKVVMYGGSFVGMTQWRTAAQHPPHLAGIAPYASIYPGWDVPNTNGIPQAWTAVILGGVSGRTLNTGYADNQEYWAGKMLEHYAAYRPFAELDDAMGLAPDDWQITDDRGRRLPFMKMWLEHLGDETFSLAAAPKAEDYRQMNLPVLSVTGFYDDDQSGALRYYRQFMANASPAAAAGHYLVIGPWDHSGTQNQPKVTNGLSLPDAAVLAMNKLQADWYDFALGRGPVPRFLHDRFAYFMLGADEWRYAKNLEAASSGAELSFFLTEPKGTPKDVFHSGQLDPGVPTSEPPAILVCDPRELPELDLTRYLPDENLTSQFRAFQKRALVFHSEPLARDTEVAGQMRLLLSCSADAPDFDLWAQVVMVRDDGSALRLGEDIRRARFRNSPFKPELLTNGQIVELRFEFNWMAQRLPAGARLRIILAPLNRPEYQKNFNTGGRLGYETLRDARIANIRIYHDEQHPSRLVLPLAAPVPTPDGETKE